ncbi:NAD(P)/FAD-dependent oxidoreductase [Psychromarinibacter sp. S121]|uniref:NAD(P)/FAD-dependent oxidoreductase n=1 Tax=Psychromarinibacter sp. S121 TaxID=3415127 RepID=UPI003C79D7D4
MTSEPGNLWEATCAETVQAPPLTGDATVDLAVIGGGFTGCSAALEAARAGASVCVLEARRIGYGGSGRNVGLVNAGLWLPPDEIVALMGEAPSARLMDALAAGPATVFAKVKEHGIACEAVQAGTLHCAHSEKGLEDLQTRFRQGNRIGAPVRLLDAAEARARVGTEVIHGALLDPRAGTVQPLGYCRGLARAAVAAGAKLHAQSPVTALTRDGETWRLSANGHTVRARKLLLATNAYHLGIDDPFRPQAAIVGFSQYATARLDADLRDQILPGGEGCWDTTMVMNSFRVDAAGRLIVGAMGNRRAPTGPIHDAFAKKLLARLFPQVKDRTLTFEHAWHGRIGMTSDHIPKVVGFGPGAYAIFGYSGRGIAPGTVFGTAAAQALLRDDPDALPLTPVDRYAERFTRLRSVYYETGAALDHARRLV